MTHTFHHHITWLTPDTELVREQLGDLGMDLAAYGWTLKWEVDLRRAQAGLVVELEGPSEPDVDERIRQAVDDVELLAHV